MTVDRKVIKLGSRLKIQGFPNTTFRAEDVGSAIRGNHIDIWFPSHKDALRFGVKKTVVTIFNALEKVSKLRGVNLEEANLGRTNLYGAKLVGANLQEANLEGTINLTIDQLTMVKTLYKAKLDDELMKQVEEKYPHLLEEPKPDE